MGLTPCPGQFSQQGLQSAQQRNARPGLAGRGWGNRSVPQCQLLSPTTELTLSAANMASLSLNSGKT